MPSTIKQNLKNKNKNKNLTKGIDYGKSHENYGWK